MRGFNKVEWKDRAESIIDSGLEAKFSQPEMKDFILSTGSKTLVETNRYDLFWVILLLLLLLFGSLCKRPY